MDTYLKEIANYLSIVPHQGRVVFAVVTCQKLHPNYLAFQKKYSWGDDAILSGCIHRIRQHLIQGDAFGTEEIISYIKLIDDVTPDTEEFSSIYTSFALDACTALHSTLEYLIDRKIDHIVNVAGYSRDTVNLYVQEIQGIIPSELELEFRIENDGFMLREKKSQIDLLNKLRSLNRNRIDDRELTNLACDSEGINLELL